MKKRELLKWGASDVEYDNSSLGDKQRAFYASDFWSFLKDIWFDGNPNHQKQLSSIHKLLADFLRLEELESPNHSNLLKQHLPARNGAGEYAERWIYYPTLTSAPQVADGPQNHLENMFQESEWRGTIVRIIGDARDRCILLPRGHLKSEIGNKAHTLWKLCQDPALRFILRSCTHELAKEMLGAIKAQFTNNDAFRRLYAHLGPPDKYESVWSATDIMVRRKESRGSAPSVSSFGMGSEVTGRHCDWIKCDDVSAEQNCNTRELKEKVRNQVQNLEAVRDPGSYFLDIGTIWADDDAHREYIRRDGHSYLTTSFMVATVRQADGSPLWPEKFSEEEIRRLERKFRNNAYKLSCQYYNQPISKATRTFSDTWIRYIEGSPHPAELAREKKLSIFVTCDPASSTKKGSDYSACIVQGQDEFRYRYILDGFRDQLPPDALPGRLADMIKKWQAIAYSYGGSLRFGIEAFGFSQYIKPALVNALRKLDASCNIEELKHNYKSKADRISVLANPYSMGMVLWPRNIPCVPHDSNHDAYNLIEVLKDEMLRFSSKGTSEHDDLLDAHAYAEIWMHPTDRPEGAAEEKEEYRVGAYSRQGSEESSRHVGRYFDPMEEQEDPGDMLESLVFGRSRKDKLVQRGVYRRGAMPYMPGMRRS